MNTMSSNTTANCATDNTAQAIVLSSSAGTPTAPISSGGTSQGSPTPVFIAGSVVTSGSRSGGTSITGNTSATFSVLRGGNATGGSARGSSAEGGNGRGGNASQGFTST
ncbi:hypothetical protein SAMD00023353_4001310 [Rosellinia necatrix]|uniref:Uncharacterized protein n=1 Tax=Rosellinia necatrix TaxID=77044 RepID=A0A1W2TMC7_ROSNE|nr:hypothetical protein SAMD00023353_4001310 [Rosellinia necatrix]